MEEKITTLPEGSRISRDIAGRTAVAVIVVGCILLMTALIIPPPGKIDDSVLVAFGEICTFAGTVLGVGNIRFKQKKERQEYEKDR